MLTLIRRRLGRTVLFSNFAYFLLMIIYYKNRIKIVFRRWIILIKIIQT